MGALRYTVPGIGITLAISIISFLMSSLQPSFDALVISLIFGMLVSNMLPDREVLAGGSEAVLKVFLPLGIGLYGIQLTFKGSSISYTPVLPAIAVTIALIFVTTYFIARGSGLEKTLSLLLSSGLAVCGASAIMVLAPLIKAGKEDTSISVVAIMTVGLTGMLIYGFMPDLLGLSAEHFAFLTGTTLPMLGQVRVASSAMGAESLLLATNFKLIRISALAVLAGLVLLFSGRKKGFYIPWFMILFFLLAAGANLSKDVQALRGIFNAAGMFSLSMALAAIGLSVDFESVTEKGIAPLYSAFLSWGIAVMSVYLVLSIIA